MIDILLNLYPWIKSLHVIAVIAWMAGLFYLPRLFVYHVEQGDRIAGVGQLFETMELRLLRVIMNPAMIVAWVCGVLLVLTPGIVDWGAVWPWTKGAGILAMTWFHHWLARRRKDFLAGQNTVSGRHYRMMNEVPTILLVVIVLSVIVRF